MAKFQPGHEKVGGREKNTPNKANLFARELLSGENCPIENALKILKESGELSDNERLQGWIKLIEYVASKLKSTEIKMDDDSKKALTLAYANPKQS